MRYIMIVVCKAIGMAITYCIQSAKKNKNFSLMRNFVTWLAIRYNLLEVKIIWFNNELNRHKTLKYCNNLRILFESCTPNTHAQNSSAKQFGQLIIEKTQTIQLSANLPHRLWKKIVATIIYLYKWTSQASNYWKSPYKLFHIYVFEKKKFLNLESLCSIIIGLWLQNIHLNKIKKQSAVFA